MPKDKDREAKRKQINELMYGLAHAAPPPRLWQTLMAQKQRETEQGLAAELHYLFDKYGYSNVMHTAIVLSAERQYAKDELAPWEDSNEKS
jgi:hypothetical protein